MVLQHRKLHVHLRRSLVFGLCFGVIMTAVGLVQLLAAPFIGISLSPSTQSASPDQARTVSVQLNSGTKDVNGGSVQVNFDSSKLSFTSISNGGSDFRIVQQQVTPSSVIFEYESTDSGGTDGFFNLANIRLTAKSVFGTHTTNLTGSALAYEGRSRPEYYPVSNLSASITITGPAAPAPSPSPSPAPSPPSSPAPPASPPTSSSSGPSNPSSPSAPLDSGQPPSALPSSPEGDSAPQGLLSDEATATDSTPTDEEPTISDLLNGQSSEEQVHNKDGSIPTVAILGALILLMDGIFFLYYRRRKTKNRPHSNKLPARDDPDLEPVATITSQTPAPQAPVQPVPLPPPPTLTAKTVMAPQPPVVAAPSKTHHAAQPISGLAIKQTWGDIRKEQAERIAHGDKNIDDKNTPDMFELANQHPESFGSQALYNEESGGKLPPAKK